LPEARGPGKIADLNRLEFRLGVTETPIHDAREMIYQEWLLHEFVSADDNTETLQASTCFVSRTGYGYDLQVGGALAQLMDDLEATQFRHQKVGYDEIGCGPVFLEQPIMAACRGLDLVTVVFQDLSYRRTACVLIVYYENLGHLDLIPYEFRSPLIHQTPLIAERFATGCSAARFGRTKLSKNHYVIPNLCRDSVI